MLQLLHPEIHGYVDAELDEKGEPIKIVCDVLEVIQYSIDSQTSPMESLAVTFARVDPNNKFKKGGPLTQHLIVGLELIAVLEEPGGITIDVIEASVLRTGIPSANIRPEDIKPYELPPHMEHHWAEELIKSIKAKMKEQKRIQEQAMIPPTPNMIPGMLSVPAPERPPTEQPPPTPLPDV